MSDPTPLQGMKARKLVHWALAYLAGGFVVFQLLDALETPLGLTAAFQRAILVIVGIGFFITLVLAWYHGEKGRQKVSGPELLMVTALLVIAGGVLSLLSNPDGSMRPFGYGDTGGRSSGDRPSVAVLPLENLSPDPDDAFFAGGLHDELLTQLAKVKGLSVISRTSVMEYAIRTKSLREIADELGAGSIVEGSVTVLGDRLRVNVQLIDAESDQHLWAEHYDRTLDDAFAIQSEVAQKVVEALGAALGSTEQEALTATPTENAEAYLLFLQGQEFFHRPGRLRSNLEIAQGLYERALELDPAFAQAYASLSQVHGHTFWFGYDPSPVRKDLQRENAEQALRLAPDLPEAHLALGESLYRADRDYEGALREFELAQEGLPNDAYLISRIGFVHRRLGHWDEVYAAFDKVTEVDPRNVDLVYDLGATTFLATRRYADAIRAYERTLELAPDFVPAAVRRGEAFVRLKGELDSLRVAVEPLPLQDDLGFIGTVASVRARLLLWERNADGLLALLQQVGAPVFETQTTFFPAALYQAWAHELKGDEEAARAAFGEALTLLDSVLVELPDELRIHAARGLTLAGLGDRDEALLEADLLAESPVFQEDLLDGTDMVMDRAIILARVGELDEALDYVERLLSNPSKLSVHTLRLNPLWDPLRNHPRFQVLLEEYRGDVEH